MQGLDANNCPRAQFPSCRGLPSIRSLCTGKNSSRRSRSHGQMLPLTPKFRLRACVKSLKIGVDTVDMEP